jgi:hypothetical protein
MPFLYPSEVHGGKQRRLLLALADSADSRGRRPRIVATHEDRAVSRGTFRRSVLFMRMDRSRPVSAAHGPNVQRLPLVPEVRVARDDHVRPERRGLRSPLPPPSRPMRDLPERAEDQATRSRPRSRDGRSSRSSLPRLQRSCPRVARWAYARSSAASPERGRVSRNVPGSRRVATS